jgi:hypothetical protein
LSACSKEHSRRRRARWTLPLVVLVAPGVTGVNEVAYQHAHDTLARGITLTMPASAPRALCKS